jgi:hypothetical protein
MGALTLVLALSIGLAMLGGRLRATDDYYVLTVGGTSTWRLIEPQTGLAASLAPIMNPVYPISWSADWTHLALLRRGELLIYDAATRQPIWSSAGMGDVTGTSVWSPDGQSFVFEVRPAVIPSDRPRLRRLDLRTLQVEDFGEAIDTGLFTGTNAIWSPDGAWLQLYQPPNLSLLNAATGRVVEISVRGLPTRTRWSLDSSTLFVMVLDSAYGSGGQGYALLKSTCFDQPSTCATHLHVQPYVNPVEVGPDGAAVIYADGTALHRVSTQGEDVAIPLPGKLATALVWSPDGRQLSLQVWVGGEVRQFLIVNMQTGRSQHYALNPASPVEGGAWLTLADALRIQPLMVQLAQVPTPNPLPQRTGEGASRQRRVSPTEVGAEP